jgi:HPt (histidine-containing phosphotransfer) domain-containing protein
MDPIERADLNEAIDGLWVKFLPQIQERVATLESSQVALAAGTLSNDKRAEANAVAHKLAGVLGTFGLTKGTILAREAEIIYSGEPETDPAAAGRLAEISSELRNIVEHRK